MIRLLTTALLVCSSVFAGRHYIQGSTTRTYTTAAAYASLTSFGETIRFKTGSSGTCTVNNVFLIGYGWGIRCKATDWSSVDFYTGELAVYTSAVTGLAADTWYFISMQRTLTAIDVVIHGMDGSVVASASKASLGSWTRQDGEYRNNVQGWSIAHQCHYSAVIASSAALIPVPKDGTCNAANLLRSWSFEADTMVSSDGVMNYTSSGSPTFADTDAYSPIVQFTLTGAAAGGTATLDATASFNFVQVGSSTPVAFDTSSVTVQQTAGPNTLGISDRRSATPTITNWIDGTYTIKLTSGSVSRSSNITITALDTEGYVLYPSPRTRRSVSVAFRLADVPGAVDVNVEVRRPDNVTSGGAICSASPCAVYFDGRQGAHEYRLTYRNGTGATLAQGMWQLAKHTASLVDNPTSPDISYGGQGARIAYATIPTAEVGPMWRYLAHVYGTGGYYDSNVPDILALNTTGRTPLYSIYTDLATVSLFQDFRALGNTPELPVDSFGIPLRELLYAHVHTNYDLGYGESTRTAITPTKLGKFGVEEACGSGSCDGANGVVRAGASTCPTGCDDKTTAAFDATTADVVMNSTYPNLLIGYGYDFDEVNFTVSTAQSGCSITWQYWNGSTWATLTLDSDTTSNLTSSGRVRFTPPADWTRSVRSGTFTKPWLRIATTGCSTYPIFSRVYGDDWRAFEMPAGDRRLWDGTQFAAADGGSFEGLTFTTFPYVNNNLVIAMQYSKADGSWATLTIDSDTTNNFKQNGSITWTPPGDWAAYDMSGSGSAKYWVKITGTGKTDTSAVTTIAGTRSGSPISVVSLAMGRGWCSTDAGVVRGGTTRAYNATPPVNCSARFEYQSRALVAWWASNAFGYNQQNILADGHYALSYGMIKHFEHKESLFGAGRFNAWFLDNLIHSNGPNLLASPTIITRGVNGDHSNNYASVVPWYQDFYALAKAKYPNITILGNGTLHDPGVFLSGKAITTMDHCKTGDACMEEGFFNFSSIANTTMPTYWTTVNDPMLTSNPRETVVSRMCTDLSDSADVAGGRYFNDRSNRAPMICLAGYYQGANRYTRFGHAAASPYAYTAKTRIAYKDVAVTINADIAAAGTSVCSASFNSLPVNSTTNYSYYLPGSGTMTLQHQASGDCMVVTVGVVVAGLSSGATIYSVSTCIFGSCMKTVDQVAYWEWIFPAILTDIGTPTADRTNAGTATYSTKRDLWWRPYTNGVAMIVLASTSDNVTSDFGTRSSTVITFSSAGWCTGGGCALYPLRADGRTDNSVCDYTSIGGSDYRTSGGGCTAYRPWRSGDGQIFLRSLTR